MESDRSGRVASCSGCLPSATSRCPRSKPSWALRGSFCGRFSYSYRFGLALSDTAIRVGNLSKSFRLRHQLKHDSLREAISHACTALFNRKQRRGAALDSFVASSEEFWALKNVSFEVQRGEVLGIIGRNGAGKSTLLKIISRITRPTEGSVEITGRIGCLLEVGTGFHPELTGRENIYLNGAILGMKRADIVRKFEEIVVFSEVERFLDTPVKHYSSGMYTRLAFAVAAHLDPEILIVDEVLAVGDAQFQKKCLGKMDEVAHAGRTILFVSHNMNAISRLCRKAIWLDGGRVSRVGDSDEVIKAYLSDDMSQSPDRQWTFPGDAPGDDRVRLLGARVTQLDQVTSVVDINKSAHVQIDFQVLRPAENLIPGINLYDPSGLCLFASCDWRSNSLRPNRYRAIVAIPPYLLAEGRISVLIQLVFYDPNVLSVILPSAIAFDAVDGNDPFAVRGAYKGSWPGVLRPGLTWTEPTML
jgi:lipopolysaccharide transport system ATP-binding protein